jgi:hypothetical protein
MDSRASDLLDVVACLRESARRGDWTAAAGLTSTVRGQTPPNRPETLGEYLRALEGALAVAKTARAEAALSLGRLNAAAKFNNARLEGPSQRQNFADAADS